jgi:murein DD-endopeptidase MepM/ murein hydrolase activator NlpD
MKQNYFIVVVAHSLHGRLRRIHVPHQVLYVVLGLALFGGISIVGFISSYARMAWKVGNYNSLKREADSLRMRYRNLQRTVNETNVQLASLQNLASEISVATGFKQKMEGPSSITSEGTLAPSYSESLQEYYFLRSVSGFRRNSFTHRFHIHSQPSIWPVNGLLEGPFGHRIDPFSGEGAHHTGVDIICPTGTIIRATGDGIVAKAEWSGGYGRLVVIDHGKGVQTYYAHMSRISVLPGQEIRQGDWVGLTGSTGRVTAPHLHYEVRLSGIPVNPMSYLKRSSMLEAAKKDFPF